MQSFYNLVKIISFNIEKLTQHFVLFRPDTIWNAPHSIICNRETHLEYITKFRTSLSKFKIMETAFLNSAKNCDVLVDQCLTYKNVL